MKDFLVKKNDEWKRNMKGIWKWKKMWMKDFFVKENDEWKRNIKKY